MGELIDLSGLARDVSPYKAVVVEKNEIKPNLWGRLRGEKPRLEVVVEEERLQSGQVVKSRETHPTPLRDYSRVQVGEDVIDNPAFYRLKPSHRSSYSPK